MEGRIEDKVEKGRKELEREMNGRENSRLGRNEGEG